MVEAAKAAHDLQELSEAWKNALKEQEDFCTDSPTPRAVLLGRPDF